MGSAAIVARLSPHWLGCQLQDVYQADRTTLSRQASMTGKGAELCVAGYRQPASPLQVCEVAVGKIALRCALSRTSTGLIRGARGQRQHQLGKGFSLPSRQSDDGEIKKIAPAPILGNKSPIRPRIR
jgi:hypothetical protein